MNQNFAFPGNSQGIPTRMANPGIMPRFKVEMQRTSDTDPETGLPKYRPVEIVELHSPGDIKNVPVKRVTPALISQYQSEYDAWKRSGNQQSALESSGLPLVHWPQLPGPIAASLAHANVLTVEQLAGLSDTQCNINGAIGIRKYRDMAAAFVEKSSAAAPIAKLDAENLALKNRLALLEKQIEQVNARAEAAETKAKGGDDIPDLSTPRDHGGGKRGKN